MEYTYISIYRYEGISCQNIDDDQLIVEDSANGVRAFITNDVNRHCIELDIGLACASMLLRGMFGGERLKELPEAINSEVKRIQEEREPKIKGGAIVVIELKGDAELNIDEKLHNETDQFRVCFDAIDKKALIDSRKNLVEAIVTSISISSNPEYRAEKIRDGVYFRDDKGKLLFSFTMKGGRARLIVSKRINDEIIDESANLIRLSSVNTQLNSVFRLFVQSLEPTQDNLRAFLSAWSAIEIFLNKTFSFYENKFLSNVAEGHDSAGVDRFLGRIQAVMKDKYRLADRLR